MNVDADYGEGAVDSNVWSSVSTFVLDNLRDSHRHLPHDWSHQEQRPLPNREFKRRRPLAVYLNQDRQLLMTLYSVEQIFKLV